jgi:hypothetical protein
MATKKVLVLCQRKTGPLHYTPIRVEEIITPKIETLVENILETDDYTIEYLSDKKGHEEGDVDILGSLEKNTSDEFTTNFLLKNKNSYSLIILNTCPFSLIPYPVIYKLLVENGFMAFSAYPSNIKDSKFKLYTPPEDRFSNITTDDMDVVLYKKIIPTQSAGKLYTMRNKSRRNKSKRNKSKKNKSRKNKSKKNKKYTIK